MDTLGRWLAHYIAELIEDAEKASAEERLGKMRTCSEAIMSLWKYRHELPNGKRPFQDLEPILRALESLNPDNTTPRYFRAAMDAANEVDEKEGPKSWLKLVEGLDYSAKVLISYCLTQASQAAIDKSAKWVALAEAAGADEGAEFPVVRVILKESEELKTLSPDDKERERLEDRVNRLEAFAQMAIAQASLLREQLQRIQGTEKREL